VWHLRPPVRRLGNVGGGRRGPPPSSSNLRGNSNSSSQQVNKGSKGKSKADASFEEKIHLAKLQAQLDRYMLPTLSFAAATKGHTRPRSTSCPRQTMFSKLDQPTDKVGESVAAIAGIMEELNRSRSPKQPSDHR
jgi:hypothetical protein